LWISTEHEGYEQERTLRKVRLRRISERLWLHMPDQVSTRTETTSCYLPPGYRLEPDSDVLTLRRPDGSVVSRFSVRGATREVVLRTAQDDRSGIPPYGGPEEHAGGVRRLMKARAEKPWERFLETERRVLNARKNGQLAKALALRLPGESQEELERMVSEDRRRAEEGLVDLRSEEGELPYKHVEELCPEDRQDRIRAELARLEWLLERQGRLRGVLRWAFSGEHPSRKSQGSIHRVA
jgi:hypothetical protein